MTGPVAVTVTVAFILLLIGEIWRIHAPGAERDAPVAQAVAIGITMSGATLPPSVAGTVTGIFILVVLAGTATLIASYVRDRWADLLPDLTRSVTTILVAGTLTRLSFGNGGTITDRLSSGEPQGGTTLGILVFAGMLAAGVPMIVRAGLRAHSTGSPFPELLAKDLRLHGILAIATGTTGAIIGYLLGPVGPVVLPLAVIPLTMLIPAVTDQHENRVAYDETIQALSELTDHANLTSPGHAERVAALAVPIAKALGASDATLATTRTAAMLHDIGQVTLRSSIPKGATTEVSPRDQRLIAKMSASILADTASLDGVASVITVAGIPNHRIIKSGTDVVAARAIRVANAYDDLVNMAPGRVVTEELIIRLALMTPRELDREAVAALLRHLGRRQFLPENVVQAGLNELA